jgi:hypothetical protein
MSFAGLTYGLFAIQQDVTLGELEPIRFKINSNPVSLNGGDEYLGADLGSTYIEGDQQQHSKTLKIGEPDASSLTGFSTGMLINGEMPESQSFTGPNDDAESTVGNNGNSFSNTGIFISDIPGAIQHGYVEMPEDPTAGKVQEVEEPKVGAVSLGVPRASVQIGLLNELSFLDD